MSEYSSDSNRKSKSQKESKRIAAEVFGNVEGYKLVHVRNRCRNV
jgi:hypothetical protein